MSKVDIEKLLYKKPDLNLGLSFFSGIRKDIVIGDDDDDTPVIINPSPTPVVGENSEGTGGN